MYEDLNQSADCNGDWDNRRLAKVRHSRIESGVWSLPPFKVCVCAPPATLPPCHHQPAPWIPARFLTPKICICVRALRQFIAANVPSKAHHTIGQKRNHTEEKKDQEAIMKLPITSQLWTWFSSSVEKHLPAEEDGKTEGINWRMACLEQLPFRIICLFSCGACAFPINFLLNFITWRKCNNREGGLPSQIGSQSEESESMSESESDYGNLYLRSGAEWKKNTERPRDGHELIWRSPP